MTQNANPLAAAKPKQVNKFEPGSDAAGQQLQDHCNRLNLIEKRPIRWVVKGKAPTRKVETEAVWGGAVSRTGMREL